MNRSLVLSSNILSIGYDQDSATLEVEFKNGSVFQYFGISQDVYSGLMNADSHGSFLDAHIKKAGYSFIQVR